MKYLYLILISMLAFQQASAQNLQPNKHKNVLRFGYGFARFTGVTYKDGQQLMLGLQNQLSRHSLLDVRLSGNLFEKSTPWVPATLIDKSMGISLEAEYGWALQWKRLMFYPSIGPAIRYSHEIHPEHFTTRYDPTIGSVILFSSPAIDKHVLQVGATGGLNFDVRIFKSLFVGLRASTQPITGASGDNIKFYGFTFKNTAWHF